jgi:hypothetical protein
MASTPSTEANQPPNAPAQAKTQRRVVSVNAEASTPRPTAARLLTSPRSVATSTTCDGSTTWMGRKPTNPSAYMPLHGHADEHFCCHAVPRARVHGWTPQSRLWLAR